MSLLWSPVCDLDLLVYFTDLIATKFAIENTQFFHRFIPDHQITKTARRCADYNAGRLRKQSCVAQTLSQVAHTGHLVPEQSKGKGRATVQRG